MRGAEAQPGELRVGVVGLGRWGRILAGRLEGTPRCRLTALCDARGDRLGAAGAAHPRASLHPSADSLLRSVDAVVIAAGGSEHAGLARAALAAGRHVLIEKPVALREADAFELGAIARAGGLRMLAGHLLRYDPVLVALEGLVHEGALGRILRVETDRTAAGAAPEANAWWALGPHDLSVVLGLLGRAPDSIHVVPTPHGSEAELRFPGGADARIRVETGPLPRKRRLALQGTRGAAVVDEGPEGLEAVLQAGGSTRVLRSEGPGPLERELEAFVAAVLDGAPAPTEADEAIEVVRLLEAGARSMDEGRPIELRTRAAVEPTPSVRPAPPRAFPATPPG